MSARRRGAIQVAVVLVGALLFVSNLADGVGIWDFLPLGAAACFLVAIDQGRRDRERDLSD
jgi:hypothetical protein